MTRGREGDGRVSEELDLAERDVGRRRRIEEPVEVSRRPRSRSFVDPPNPGVLIRRERSEGVDLQRKKDEAMIATTEGQKAVKVPPGLQKVRVRREKGPECF